MQSQWKDAARRELRVIDSGEANGASSATPVSTTAFLSAPLFHSTVHNFLAGVQMRSVGESGRRYGQIFARNEQICTNV